jgi:hypothetical protein
MPFSLPQVVHHCTLLSPTAYLVSYSIVPSERGTQNWRPTRVSASLAPIPPKSVVTAVWLWAIEYGGTHPMTSSAREGKGAEQETSCATANTSGERE